ncbi:MAG: hypothetical protein U5K81_15625 [Trueperaceae bacterium]|nr:hypothetical protein [Trueperaceae bacterium]
MLKRADPGDLRGEIPRQRLVAPLRLAPFEVGAQHLRQGIQKRLLFRKERAVLVFGRRRLSQVRDAKPATPSNVGDAVALLHPGGFAEGRRCRLESTAVHLVKLEVGGGVARKTQGLRQVADQLVEYGLERGLLVAQQDRRSVQHAELLDPFAQFDQESLAFLFGPLGLGDVGGRAEKDHGAVVADGPRDGWSRSEWWHYPW